MMDKKPGPWRITFDTNPDDCNLRCIMCEEHSIYSQCQIKRKAEGRSRRRMDIDLMRKVLEESKGSPLKEIIPSTMGEPLLYRHFEKIIDLCHEFNVKMNLTTNGTFPKFGATEWAKKIVPIGSDVKISWNGATKETSEKIMIGSNFEQRVQNVRDFIQVRNEIAAQGRNSCRVTFQLTFIEIGIEEIPEVVKLAAALGVNRVKGHHLWIFTKEMENQSMRRSKEVIQRWNQIVAKAHVAAENFRLPNGEKVLLENIYALDETAEKELVPQGVCPFLGKEAWVSAEGLFGPCCAPDKERKKLGNFGSLHHQSIQTVWQSDAYQKLQKNYLNYDVCQSCNMRKKPEELYENGSEVELDDLPSLSR
ncbi:MULTISPECIES: radical SAM protein [Candidatus Rhabdochlamydia]|nr:MULTISPECIES: radical SAM protein [Rhabdochlamydia]